MESSATLVSGEQIVALTGILATALTILVIILAAIAVPYWRKVRIAEAELKLKSEMVAAGFSADDIAQVIQTSAAGPRFASRPRPLAVPAHDAIRARY